MSAARGCAKAAVRHKVQSCRKMVPVPNTASAVFTALRGVPQMPCRPTHCPVRNKLRTLVTTGTCERMKSWASALMPYIDPAGE